EGRRSGQDGAQRDDWLRRAGLCALLVTQGADGGRGKQSRVSLEEISKVRVGLSFHFDACDRGGIREASVGKPGESFTLGVSAYLRRSRPADKHRGHAQTGSSPFHRGRAWRDRDRG